MSAIEEGEGGDDDVEKELAIVAREDGQFVLWRITPGSREPLMIFHDLLDAEMCLASCQRQLDLNLPI